MSVAEIEALRENIQKEIDDLWELKDVLWSIQRVIEFFSGKKRSLTNLLSKLIKAEMRLKKLSPLCLFLSGNTRRARGGKHM